ncbi:MAG: apolipoprotein N-acyltransferase [Aliishimia sp.]
MAILSPLARLPLWPRWMRVALFVALGTGAALGQPPQGYWGITLGAFAVLFTALSYARSPKQAALWFWIFGTAYFAVALRWIIEPFMVDVARHGWMAPFAIIFLSGGLALFWGVAGWVSVRFGASAQSRVWIAVFALGLAELVRAYVLTGFPWAGLGQTLISSPFAAWLSVIGPQGATLLMLSCSAGLWSLNTNGATRTFGILPFAVAGIVQWSASIPPEIAADDAPIVRVLQPNAPQHEKWDRDKAPTFFWRQVDATSAPFEGGGRPDLVVWPETAIPSLLHLADEALERVGEAAQGTPVVLGMQRVEGVRFFNALLIMNRDGQISDIYDKHHLVPFGEYIPFGNLLGKIGIRGLAARDGDGYSSGSGPRLIDIPGVGAALPLICYEAVFPQHARVGAQRPRLLLQITNDAWFGTYAGPQQHLAQARMRAIEQGLPLVRSANTGISAIIDGHGRIVTSLPLGTHGFKDAPLPPAFTPTVYAVTGDLPFALIALLGLGLTSGGRLIARKDKLKID